MYLNRELTRFASGSKLVSLLDDSLGCWLAALLLSFFNFLFNFHFNFLLTPLFFTFHFSFLTPDVLLSVCSSTSLLPLLHSLSL